MSTVGDFWRMVWQYKVDHIVMVTGLCEGGRVSFLYHNDVSSVLLELLKRRE